MILHVCALVNVCMRLCVCVMVRDLAAAEVLHTLGDLGRVGGEEVRVICQLQVLDEELSDGLQGDLLEVHLTALHSQKADVPAHTHT